MNKSIVCKKCGRDNIKPITLTAKGKESQHNQCRHCGEELLASLSPRYDKPAFSLYSNGRSRVGNERGSLNINVVVITASLILSSLILVFALRFSGVEDKVEITENISVNHKVLLLDFAKTGFEELSITDRKRVQTWLKKNYNYRARIDGIWGMNTFQSLKSAYNSKNYTSLNSMFLKALAETENFLTDYDTPNHSVSKQQENTDYIRMLNRDIQQLRMACAISGPRGVGYRLADARLRALTNGREGCPEPKKLGITQCQVTGSAGSSASVTCLDF